MICLVCEKKKEPEGIAVLMDQAFPRGLPIVCEDCRRHADLGKAVEAVIVEHSTFWIRQRTWMDGQPWQVSIPDVVKCHDEIGTGSTPLAALRSAVKP